MLEATPCALCGYDAPGTRCPHCDLTPRTPTLRWPASRGLTGIADGFRAVPVGLWLLAKHRGLKRFLVPPVLLTAALFVALCMWLWSLAERLVEAVDKDSLDSLGLEDGWLLRVLEWIVAQSVVTWTLHAGGVILAIVVSSVAALWTFSLAYEALAGPFLDEIHGRLETRWFGENPRDRIQRPTDLPVRTCALLTTVGAAPALVLLGVWYASSGAAAWIALSLAPLGWVLLGIANREYGKWLWWVVRLESETLWVSVKASLLAGFLLLFFLWLKLVPVIGFVLFMALAGFTTSLSLLDIPFSRRQWALRTRLSFLGRHAIAVSAYGAVASLLFLIPVLGPVLMVPAASIGGLWLLCRLDKSSLRHGLPLRGGSES